MFIFPTTLAEECYFFYTLLLNKAVYKLVLFILMIKILAIDSCYIFFLNPWKRCCT